MNKNADKIALLFAIVSGVSFGLFAGSYITTILFRNEAIENNVAEYRVDPKTGATTFTWLPCEERTK